MMAIDDDEYRNVKNKEVSETLRRAGERFLEQRFGDNREMQAEVKNLEQRQFGVQKRIAELKTKIQTRGVYAKRLANYIPLLGSEFACPKCWVLDERTAAMTEGQFGHHSAPDGYRFDCPRCRETYSIRVRWDF